MSRAKSLTEGERKSVGDVLRRLRRASGLTQADVANHLGISKIMSAYESGEASMSASKALDFLQSLAATPEDGQTIQGLVSAIPSLADEVRLRELVEQAEREGALKKWRTATWIAETSGFAYSTVVSRLKKAR